MKTNEIITQKFIDSLQAGQIPWRKPWSSLELLNANIMTEKPYQGVNQLLTWLGSYTSPYWATEKQWDSIGANKKAGERGTMICYYTMLESKDKKEKDGKAKRFPLLRYFTVFNVDQVENLKLDRKFTHPEPESREFNPIDRAESLLSVFSGLIPRIEHDGGGRAFYRPATDSIHMPKKEHFNSPQEYYSTLFHEIGHGTGHHSRLNRKDQNSPNFLWVDHAYGFEELVAEITSAFLCAHVGIDNTLENSTAYIQNWIQSLKNDPNMIIKAASQAQKAFDYLLRKEKVEVLDIAA